MRERIFRGKRVDNGEWVEGGIVHQTDWYGNAVDKYFIIDGTYTYDYDIGEPELVVPETVGEYTGLTDKNGKRIFEGDIIIYVGEVCLVKWDDETAKFVLENKNLLCDFEEVWCNRFKVNVVIIGTIYDDSELLEGWQ